METSRDDFVIAIRSAFLKKSNKQTFSIIGLIFFSIFLIVLGKFNFKAVNYLKTAINEVVYRSSFVVSIPENYIKYAYLKINDHFNLYKDYDLTKKKIKDLESQKYNFDFIIAENDRLKKTLNDISFSSDEKVAKVLLDKESPFLRSVIINKGSKDQIKKGMAVLSNHYLIGKVIETNFTTSRVLLLSDINSKIPITIEPGSYQSILSGNGKESGIMKYSRKNYPIKVGNVVYTSGTGGLFKSGIPIGKISELNPNSNHKVDFFSDFSQLDYVKAVFFGKKDLE